MRKIGLRIILFLILFSTGFFAVGKATVKVLKPQYTDDFEIVYMNDGSKKLRDSDGKILWLYPRTKKEKLSNVSALAKVPYPLQRGHFASLTTVCLLRPLNRNDIWNSVVAVNSQQDEWYIQAIKERMQQGKIIYTGDFFKPDFERIKSARPEVAIIYTGPAGTANMRSKLNSIGIPVFAENSYLETNPLGRMEWVKCIAAFYDCEEQAAEYFDQAVRRVNRIEQKIKNLKRKKIKVAWGNIYNGKAYIPGNKSFVAEMLRRAGGENVFAALSNSQGSLEVSLEEFYACSKEADLLIYTTYPQYAPNIRAIVSETPILAQIKPVRTKRVWALQPWYNQQFDRIDEVIYDLAAIFYPQEFSEREQSNFAKLK